MGSRAGVGRPKKSCGRPKKSCGLLLGHVGVHLNGRLQAAVESAAARCGQTVPEWVRNALFIASWAD